MRRFLLILLVALLGSTAAAQDLRFGVRLGVDVSNAVAVWVRYDDNRLENGFGVRVQIGSTVLLNSADVTAYHRFASDGRGSGGYVGASGGVFAVFSFLFAPPNGATVDFAPFFGALVGYTHAFNDSVALFVEARVVALLGGIIVPFPLLGLGVNIAL
jgi:hypothetical protein